MLAASPRDPLTPAAVCSSPACQSGCEKILAPSQQIRQRIDEHKRSKLSLRGCEEIVKSCQLRRRSDPDRDNCHSICPAAASGSRMRSPLSSPIRDRPPLARPPQGKLRHRALVQSAETSSCNFLDHERSSARCISPVIARRTVRPRSRSSARMSPDTGSVNAKMAPPCLLDKRDHRTQFLSHPADRASLSSAATRCHTAGTSAGCRPETAPPAWKSERRAPADTAPRRRSSMSGKCHGVTDSPPRR